MTVEKAMEEFRQGSNLKYVKHGVIGCAIGDHIAHCYMSASNDPNPEVEM